jgi:hypothetical protein
VLAEYEVAERAYELSKKAAELAHAVARDFSTAARPRFVSGSVGPTTKLVSLGHVSFDEQRRSFRDQIRGMLDGGIDIVQIETSQDLLQTKCAVIAAREAMRESGREVPIIAQITIETTGTMLVGTEIAAALPALEALDVDVVGMNCALGPDLMTEHVRYLGAHATRWVSVLPNAGLPRNVGGVATYDLTPEALAHFGKNAIFGGYSNINRSQMIDEIALAVKTLAKNHTGALIVVERDIGLKSYVESGIAVNGLLSYDLLVTVFNPKEPMHDGAVIIQNGRIAAAACFLPLTTNPAVPANLVIP